MLFFLKRLIKKIKGQAGELNLHFSTSKLQRHEYQLRGLPGANNQLGHIHMVKELPDPISPSHSLSSLYNSNHGMSKWGGSLALQT